MKTFKEFLNELEGRSTEELVAELKGVFTPDKSSNETVNINRKPGGKFEVVEFLHGEPGSLELTSRGATGGQRAVMTGSFIIDDFEKLKTFIKNGRYANIGI